MGEQIENLIILCTAIFSFVVMPTIAHWIYTSWSRTDTEKLQRKKDIAEHRNNIDDNIWRTMYLGLFYRYECIGCKARFMFAYELGEHEENCSHYYIYEARKSAFEA